MLKQPLQRPRPIFKLVWNLCGRIGWRSATMASQPEKLRQWAQTKQLSVCRLCRIAHARKDTGTCHLCKIPFQNHIKKAVFGAWNGGGHGAVRVALHFTDLTCGPGLDLTRSIHRYPGQRHWQESCQKRRGEGQAQRRAVVDLMFMILT